MIVLALLIPLAVLGAIVVGVVAAVRRARGGSEEGGGVRRSVAYLLAYGLLVTAATGLSQLVALLIPSGPTLTGRGAGDLASAVSLTVVATPAFLGLWSYLRRRLQTDPTERESPALGVFATLAAPTFLIGGLAGLGNGIAWLLGLRPDGRTALAFGLVWSATWAWTWSLRREARPPELAAAPVVIGSLVGLAVAAPSLAALLGNLFAQAYDRLADPAVAVSGQAVDLWRALVWLVLGGAVWWWHWPRHAERGPHTPLHRVYLLVFGVLAGALTALGAAGIVLFSILEWLFGDPFAGRAPAHFAETPAQVAVLLTGLLVWAYHRSVVLRSGPEATAGDIGRTYRYLLAGTGLIASASGLGVVINALLGATVPALSGGSDVVDTLLGGITALIVGLPVWWRTWSPLAAASDEEASATPRRIYLTALAGIGTVVAVVTAIVFLYRLLQGVLEGIGAAAIVDDVRAPLGILTATGIVAAYHLSVWRRDRARIEAAPRQARPAALRHLVLVAADPGDLPAALRREGMAVTVFRTEGEGGIDADAVRRAISEAADGTRRMLVLADGAEVRAYPLRD